MNPRRWGSGSPGNGDWKSNVLMSFRKVVRDSQKRMLRGNEFQRVGADTQTECEPNRRLVRGTCRSLDVEEHTALVGAYGYMLHSESGMLEKSP